MIDLFDLYQSFASYVNTYIGGWFRPQSDFTASCNDISSALWVKWTREAEKSQEAKDNLVPFLISGNFIVQKNKTIATFPMPSKDGKKYGRFAAARIIVAENNCCVPCQEVNNGQCSNGDFKTQAELSEDYYNTVKQWNVEMIDTQKWGSVMEHKTKGPKMSSPKMRQINNAFEVAPRDVSVIVLDYYRPPELATFIYTIAPGNVQTGAGDNIIYDRKNSKPLEWPSSLRNEFLINLGERYGLFTREQFVYNATAQQKQTA